MAEERKENFKINKMRTILFRGQKLNTNEWVEGELIFEIHNRVALNTPSIHHLEGNDSHGAFTRVKPETVGEFTGLTDKNGKRIFEGDILEGFKYPVTYEDGCFCVTIEYDLVRCWLNSECCNLENLEVIGNIHDNAILIKK